MKGDMMMDNKFFNFVSEYWDQIKAFLQMIAEFCQKVADDVKAD